MKANRIHAYGPPDVIRFEDVSVPEPGEGEVLVRVRAAGVGPWDALVRSGRSGLPQPLPLTLGTEVAGTQVVRNGWVLILGAAGNVGRFAVQMAHALGAHVIAAVSSDNVDYVRDLGSDETCDILDAISRDGDRHCA